MKPEETREGLRSAPFAVAAAVTILFSAALACVKDAYPRLLGVMNAVAIHNWITHGLADVVVFLGVGLMLSTGGWAHRMAPSRLIALLVASAAISGVGLFAWYAVF
jgi:hypothetical protein